MTAAPPAVPRQAATVLMLRDDPQGLQVWFMRRPARSSFAASAYVFPGGAVDPADHTLDLSTLAPGFDVSRAAQRMNLATHKETADGSIPSRAAGDVGGIRGVELAAALHVAAVREVFEETGMLLGTHADGKDLTAADASKLAAARAELLAGNTFADVLSANNLRIAPQRLAYVAHFITPEAEPRRYDTRFFAAIAPKEQEPAHHQAEATASGWYAAAQALDMTKGEWLLMLPPTRIMCAEVCAHDTAASVLADLGTRDVDGILFGMDDIISGRLPTTLPTTWPPPPSPA
jgi:8-oxo-dGTP pyrophosphatase MutT (NUDIX family)